jgi:hypothetical protein
VKKNVASQVVGAQMISASDGSAITSGTVSVLVTKDNGTQTAGSETAPAHKGNGLWTYAPSQAETNADHVAFTFTHTSAVPVTVQLYATFPQTGDSFARIGANGAGLTDLATAAALATVDSNVDAILADTGTDGVVVAAGSKSGYTLSSAGIQAIWDALTSALTTAGSIGKLFVDNINATISSRMPTSHIDATAGKVDGVALVDTTTTNTDMRGTNSALLASSAPTNFSDLAITATTGRVTVGAVGGDAVTGANDLKADVSGLSTHSATDVWAAATRTLTAGTKDSQIDAIKAKTDNLTFTTTNQVDARVNSIRGSAGAAEKLERAVRSEVLVTVAGSSTATAVIASSLAPASAVADQFKGRHLIFAEDTTTTALRGQATDITAFNHATQTFTVTALTTAPVNGDTAIVV